ncbi:hypothetical protein GT348_06775 [Aristophania vespae]|uniref:CDP-glycerol--glycerophosphate glycerophosphotransferase n=1 Tax=Aristophania vespae TaxID=2697033 RepID=A0A6P1NGE6_9PROT|nr:hypothetical protein [Aristophania vespae]QHI95977.1 hypothetical protein GT348_06775 [Aristophania vespae]
MSENKFLQNSILELDGKINNINNLLINFAELIQLSVIKQQNSEIILNNLKDSINLLMQKNTCNKKIRCFFLIHSISMWDSLSDIYRRMAQDERFEPIIFTIPSRIISSGDFTGEEAVSDAFTKMGISHYRLEMTDSFDGLTILKNMSPDIIFRQQPWDGDMMTCYAAQDLNFARLCLVPYSPWMLDMDKIAQSGINFDRTYHRLAWRLFSECPDSSETYSQNPHIDQDRVIFSGLSKIDSLLLHKDKGVWPFPEKEKRPYRVIWSTHYSAYEESFQFSVFNQICLLMLEWAQKTPDIEFVFKPHQGLRNGVIKSGFMTAEQYDKYISVWESLDNCAVSLGDYASLFDASDLMVTDGISFLAEYQFFDKPIIFFDSGSHAAFNSLGELAASCSKKVSSFPEMVEAVSYYKNGGKWEYVAEREALKETLYPSGQSPSQLIIEAIYEGFQRESNS